MSKIDWNDGEPLHLPSRADHLNYLADMILDLRDLSEKSGFATLAAFLQLAHVEALQQAKASRS